MSRLLHAGAVVTALVAVAPMLDLATVDTIAGHVRDAYPGWPADSVAADRDAIAIYLVVVGVLGFSGWAWTIRLVGRGAASARVVATVLFTLGALTALTTLSYGAAPYDTIVPTLYGLLGLCPVLVGGATVVELWRLPQNTGPAPARAEGR